MWIVAKVKAMLSSIWEVVLVKSEDGMISTDEGGAGAEAEASDMSCQILCPKNIKVVLPRKRKELNQWKVHRMQAALNLYYKHLDLYKNPCTANASWCAAQFGIPPSTFSHRVSDALSSRKIKGAQHESGGAHRSKIFKDRGNFSLAYIYIIGLSFSHTNGHNSLILSTKKILHLDDEVQIAECMAEFQAHGFPLTMSHVHCLAWQFANINGIPGFPKDKRKAGRTWVQGFLKRFSQLTCRKTTNLSVARAMAANEPNICKWFVEYQKVLHDLKIPNQYQFGPVMRQGYRMFQRRKRSSVRNVNQTIKPLLLTKGKPLRC